MSQPPTLTPPRPTLDLSGPKLRAALEGVICASEAVGGVERFVDALKLKGAVITERLGEGRATTLSRAAFEEMCQLMPTARRRIGPLNDARGWPSLRAAIVELLRDANIPGTADHRIATFERALTLPSPRSFAETVPGAQAPIQHAGRMRGGNALELEAALHDSLLPLTPAPLPVEETGRGQALRFHRDLAAEILHGVYPEHYPLMTRWVWDAAANSGALREIWHDPTSGDEVDHIVINAPDTYETFLVLREELSQFLSDNGIFRDMIWYVDLLLGHVYGSYINSQGGAWLKTEFGSETDPLEHTRRILGVDARIAKAKKVSGG